MSPALDESSAIWCFEGSEAIEIRNGITFDFYTGLPHISVTILRNVHMDISKHSDRHMAIHSSLDTYIIMQEDD